jgi:putative ABC transport system permease protein
MLSDLLADAMRNLRAHWLRVLLTGSGIVWGVALFVALTAVGSANRAHYRERMAVIGRKVVFAFPGVIRRHGASQRAARTVGLEREDAARLPASPLIERAAPEVWTGPRVLKGGGRIKVVWTYGVGADAGAIRNFTVARGRFISPADVAGRRRVLVIGATVEKRLFGRRSGLGRRVRLDGHPFRIVGVSIPKGQQMINMGPNDDEQVLMPITTAQTLFTRHDRLQYIVYAPRTRPEGAASTARVRAVVGPHRDFDPRDEEAMTFFNVAEAARITETIGLGLQIFLFGCGLLTLAAGGIGVMNIMLVAVAERTRELGLRTALGATDRDVFLQLLAESVVLTLAAGGAGVALGAAILAALDALQGAAPGAEMLVPELHFSPRQALLAFTVLTGVGILAGLVPARRASRLDPAVALRQE